MKKEVAHKVLAGTLIIHFVLQVLTGVVAWIMALYVDQDLAHPGDNEFARKMIVTMNTTQKYYNMARWPAVRLMPVVLVLAALVCSYSVLEIFRIAGMVALADLLAAVLLFPSAFTITAFRYTDIISYMTISGAYWLIGACFVAAFISWIKCWEVKRVAGGS